MYHLELRQFPHNLCRFNLTEAQLRAVTGPWADGRRVQLGERSWDPHHARLTVLDGPEIAASNLTMGRGWRHAQRHSEDVTERELHAALGARAVGAAGAEGATRPAVPTPHGDALGVRSLLGDRPEALLASWQSAAQRHPGRAPSELLALAERELDAGDATVPERAPRAVPRSPR